MVGTVLRKPPSMGDQSDRTEGELMVQVVCEQIHLRCASPLEQLEDLGNTFLETTPPCFFMYDTVAMLSDLVTVFDQGLPAPDAGGQVNRSEL